jgi:hypothetical protein
MTDPVDIKPARKKKQQNSPKPPTITVQVAFKNIMDVLNCSQFAMLADFPKRLYLIEPDLGTKLCIVADERDVVVQVDDSHVSDLLMQYSQRELLVEHSIYQFLPDRADSCIRYWKKSTAKTVKPADVRWDDEPGLAYHRMPWAREGGHTPEWDRLIERMGINGSSFMAFVGSIFVPEADTQQYLYLYGEGGNGKGAITRFLEKALGPSFKNEMVPGKDDKFWTSGLLNKRVINFPDSNAAGFLASGLFKMLTGGDTVRMELKGGKTFNARLSSKFIFSSNEKPRISSEQADMRRAIYIELPQLDGPPDPSYESRLWSEGGAFISNCIDAYTAMCPQHQAIDVNADLLTAHVCTLEEEYEVFAEDQFNFYPAQPGEAPHGRPFTPPPKMQDMLKNRWNDLRGREAFLKYIERHHRVRRSRVRLPDATLAWRYVGIEPK